MTYQCGQVAGITAGAVVLAVIGAALTLAGIKLHGLIQTH